MRSLVAQITDKDGVRIQRFSLDQNGISIGRSWNSDIIIQDRFVDAEHLSLSLSDDGKLLLEDLSSTNGSQLNGKLLRATQKNYVLESDVRLGDTSIRFFDADANVAPAALRSKWFVLAERFSSWSSLLVLTIVAAFVHTMVIELRTTEPVQLDALLVSIAGVLALLLIWSLVLGFIAKLIRGESNARALWVLACLGVIIANALTIAILVIRFNLQDHVIGQWVSVLCFGAFAIWLLVGTFSYISSMSVSRKWLVSLLVVISTYGLMRSDDLLREPHQSWRSFTKTEAATLPPVMLLRQGVSLDEYQNAAEDLFDAVPE